MSGDVAPGRARHAAWPALQDAWSRLWFQSAPTTPLDIARIGIGVALLQHYAFATPYLLTFWGDSGWMPPELLAAENLPPWQQSIFFYFTAPWQWFAFHGLFLACCAALALGWRTAWVKWIVLIGQISYDYRNPVLTYGVDGILTSLLLIMCFAPTGRALSLDRVRAVRRAKRKDLNARPPQYTSEWAFACTRLMQIQMAVLFFYSAANKLKGDDWWNGDAIWLVFTDHYYFNETIIAFLAAHYWLVNVATYGTVVIEIAFPFLIWQRATRPYLLVAALFLHLQFFVWMYLHFFSWVMSMGHMSFLRPEWLARLGAWWKRKTGPMEMVYDGQCGFCKRSMAWFLAFDGLNQIAIRDFRSDPSPVVSHEKLLKHLYLVLPDGRALPGFEAYRYAVARVPGLWWQVPFFYVPMFSRLIGTPVYDWVAAHRGKLSRYVFP